MKGVAARNGNQGSIKASCCLVQPKFGFAFGSHPYLAGIGWWYLTVLRIEEDDEGGLQARLKRALKLDCRPGLASALSAVLCGK